MIALVTGAAFLAMGLAALARPGRIMATFGVHAVTPDLRNEVRAVYGGFGVAFGALLLASAQLGALAAGVQLAAGVALLGMAAGRVAGWCVERSGRWPVLFGVIECVAGAALLRAV